MSIKIPILFHTYISELKQLGNTLEVVFVDGSDKRVVNAAKWLTENSVCKCILITKEAIAQQTSDKRKTYVDKLVNLRKHKNMTINQAEELIKEPRYFGALSVILGKGDVIVAGANISTKDALLPFLQLFRKQNKFVSSIFLMIKKEQVFLTSDCALNFVTSSNVLANIAENVYWYHKMLFRYEPLIALLSFSTKSSGSGSNVKLVQEAYQQLISEKGYSSTNFYGEIQVDAAVDKQVAKTKKISNKVAGNANCFVFPSLNAANIGYKIMAYFGDYRAVGPILTNVDYCCSDLSRGCTETEVILTAILLCKQYVSLKKHHG